MSRLRHLEWEQCSHGVYFQGLWKVVTTIASGRCVLLVQLRIFRMALVSSDIAPPLFSKRFLPWSLIGQGGWAGKRGEVTSTHSFGASSGGE